MNLIFSHLITQNRDAFLQRVVDISRQLGIDPNWLMAVMWKESRINHTAVNSVSNATGLIQFMPATAQDLGTTTAALLRLSNVQQLDWVLAYFRPFRNR
ncbi:MAG: transglycosylase SLT domain-containing protein, partial [Bacteroidales bacterium]|nr:transglycosylase SLT domain-containing protein [Bacteroidales bacterium]